MTTRIMFSLALLGLLACKKDDAPTATPEDAGATDTAAPNEAPSGADTGVAQEADPPELQQGAHLYMLGQYDQAIAVLDPLLKDLEERKQLRASGLAAGWLALAHAQIVFENAEEPYKYALVMAEQTHDPEVTALAKVAHGAFLLGQEDYEAAGQAFLAASEAHSDSLAGALASILRAESLIGSAFGSGASETLESPEDLDAAKQAYTAAAKVAERGVETDIVMGRVEEGLAAIAKFQRDKEATCQHAMASVKHLRAAQASEFLIDGPNRMIQEHRCQ